MQKTYKLNWFMKELCKFLNNNNHDFCRIMYFNNLEFKWCGDVCKQKLIYEDMAKRQKEEDRFMKMYNNKFMKMYHNEWNQMNDHEFDFSFELFFLSNM
ncbi:hypothetical protein QKC54_gp1017 [Megavirus baoshan]|uniref:Uncharacterized protein n=1 Tax=Megavirus baoshan TaxID=2496520 RepID=A0A8K1T0S9_9VIRU|nr:hypothetical protein QKC54_gp1017 [Megavirus baoshan]UFX99720.1 hypothetical protein Mb0055 [Megavirus baoshan]